VSDVIRQRRSVRRLAADPVPPLIVRDLVALACTAPAPHHSRPWRFVNVTSAEAREWLADAMGEAWFGDMEQEGSIVGEVDRLIKRSRQEILGAPVLLVSCLDLGDAKPWPDERRRQAERDMFVQSLGAALQNMLLGAVERGLAGYLKGAPLFCAPAVREALDLPKGWEPAFLVLLGYPESGIEPAARAPAPLEEHLEER
jgi:F420 biosynthesis protein FbiB-like protein